MAGERKLTLRPNGRVVEGRSGPDQDGGQEQDTAEIELDDAWSEALDGIEGFSHIWVLWWLDRFEEPPSALCVHPEQKPEMPLVGLFATRSPHRPNPIAMTATRLLERKGARLRVEGLDAYTGTPILDIKPYLRRGDQIPDAVMPEWLEQLWHIHDVEQGTL